MMPATRTEVHVDFPAVMQRMRRIRTRISRVDSVQRLSTAGDDVFLGEARFTGTDALSVDGTRLRFKKALIGFKRMTQPKCRFSSSSAG